MTSLSGVGRTNQDHPQELWKSTMSTEQEDGALWADLQALERAIERQVMQRTSRRIQALEVKVSNNLVVVRGRAPSYYVGQLALQGVLDLVESAGAMRIELNIQVGSPPRPGSTVPHPSARAQS
jgi:hypothetical protein